MKRLSRHAIPTWLLLIPMACSESPDTSADEKLEMRQQPEQAWQVGDSAVLTIGEEGVAQYEFGDIIGLGKLTSGEWVVYDRGPRQLRFYDDRGKYVRSAGRNGEGPGEFRDVWFMKVVEGQSIYTYDQLLKRLTLWDAEGNVRKTWVTYLPSVGAVFRAIGQPDPRTFVLMNFVTPPCAEGVIGIDSVVYYRFNLDRRRARRSAEIDPADVAPIATTTGGQSFGSTLNVTKRCLPGRIPFTPGPLETVADGKLHIATRAGVKLIRYSFSTSLTDTVIVPIARRALTRQTIDAHIDRVVSATPRDEMGRPLPGNAGTDLYERFLRTLPYPDSLPAIDQLVVDAAGLTWLRAYVLPEDTAAEWTVVRPEGRLAARLTMPVGLRVFEIGEDYVAGIERDDLDVQRIVVRSLRRGQ